MTEAEEQKPHDVIIEHYPERFLNETEISINCGIRKSEQFSLTWDRVDLTAKKVHLLKTKNGKPRSIPLNSIAMAAFKRQRELTGESTHVFLNDDDKPFPRKVQRHWFDAALRKAGIDDFHWHDQRHTFCSRLAMAGVPLKTIQELAGHKTIQMTARYAHLSPNHLQDAVEMITARQRPPRRRKKATAPKQSRRKNRKATATGTNTATQ